MQRGVALLVDVFTQSLAAASEPRSQRGILTNSRRRVISRQASKSMVRRRPGFEARIHISGTHCTAPQEGRSDHRSEPVRFATDGFSNRPELNYALSATA
eukprot:1319689-Rhodomonas_salina.3